MKAYKGNQTLYATTGEDGDFSLEVPEPGAWTFVALERGSYASKTMPVEMDQDQPNIHIYMDRIAETADDKAGTIFFWVLIGALGVLMVVYLLTHLLFFKSGAGFEIWSKDPQR